MAAQSRHRRQGLVSILIAVAVVVMVTCVATPATAAPAAPAPVAHSSSSGSGSDRPRVCIASTEIIGSIDASPAARALGQLAAYMQHTHNAAVTVLYAGAPLAPSALQHWSGKHKEAGLAFVPLLVHPAAASTSRAQRPPLLPELYGTRRGALPAGEPPMVQAFVTYRWLRERGHGACHVLHVAAPDHGLAYYAITGRQLGLPTVHSLPVVVHSATAVAVAGAEAEAGDGGAREPSDRSADAVASHMADATLAAADVIVRHSVGAATARAALAGGTPVVELPALLGGIQQQHHQQADLQPWADLHDQLRGMQLPTPHDDISDATVLVLVAPPLDSSPCVHAADDCDAYAALQQTLSALQAQSHPHTALHIAVLDSLGAQPGSSSSSNSVQHLVEASRDSQQGAPHASIQVLSVDGTIEQVVNTYVHGCLLRRHHMYNLSTHHAHSLHPHPQSSCTIR